jgi:YVTN family beta-propeller protein
MIMDPLELQKFTPREPAEAARQRKIAGCRNESSRMFPLAHARALRARLSLLAFVSPALLAPTLLAPILLALALLVPAAAHAAFVIVLNSNDDTLSLVDPKTGTETKRVPIGRGPHHMMALPDDSALLIGLTTVNQLLVVDRKTGNVTKRIPMMDPYQLGFSPDGKFFVTTALRQDYVDIYPGQLTDNIKPIARVKSGSMPSHLAFSPDSRFAYITEQGGNSLSKIELATAKVVSRIQVGAAPAGVWLTPDGSKLLVGIMGQDFVAVIDRATEKVIGKIVTGRGAHNFLAKGDKRHLFVSNRVDDTITVVDMLELKVVEQIKVPGSPDCMELSADGKTMWVTARVRNEVVVLNMETKQVEKRIRVGNSPHGIYYFDHAPRQ